MLNRLNPRQRKIALALAAGLALALVVMVTRRRAGGQADTSVSTAGSTAAPPAGSTFADNGEAAAGLSTAITQGLGDVSSALDAVTGNQQTLADRIDALPATVPVEPAGAGDAALVAAGAAAVIQGINSTPSGARSAAKKATSKPKPAAPKRATKKPAKRKTKVGTVGKTTAGLGHPSKPPAKTHTAPAKRPRKK